MAVVCGNDEKRSGFCVILWRLCVGPFQKIQTKQAEILPFIGRGIEIFRGQKNTFAISIIVSRYRDNLASSDSTQI